MVHEVGDVATGWMDGDAVFGEGCGTVVDDALASPDQLATLPSGACWILRAGVALRSPGDVAEPRCAVEGVGAVAAPSRRLPAHGRVMVECGHQHAFTAGEVREPPSDVGNDL